MTIKELETRLKKYIPSLRIRLSWIDDVAAIFDGDRYLIRINKGEQPLYSWRSPVIITEEDRYLQEKHGQALPIGKKHRGRMQALQMLVNMRYLTQRQAQEIMW